MFCFCFPFYFTKNGNFRVFPDSWVTHTCRPMAGSFTFPLSKSSRSMMSIIKSSAITSQVRHNLNNKLHIWTARGAGTTCRFFTIFHQVPVHPSMIMIIIKTWTVFAIFLITKYAHKSLSHHWVEIALYKTTVHLSQNVMFSLVLREKRGGRRA